MTNYKSTSAGYNDEDFQREKCMRIIEAVFGPEKPIPEDSELRTGPTIPDSQIVTFEKGVAGKVNEINCNFAENNTVNATIPEEGDEKLVQKLEKIEETPLVEAEQKRADELNTNKTPVWFSDRNMCRANCEPRGDINILDEVAKRCMNTPKDKIDSKLLEEMEKIGILQPYSRQPSSIPAMEDEIVQMGCPRKSRKPKKKKEIELEIRILERNAIKMPRRNFLNRRAMRHHRAMNSGNRDILDRSTRRKPSVMLETNTAQETSRECERQQESTVEGDLLHSNRNVKEDQKQFKNLNVKNIDNQDPLVMNTSASFNSETIAHKNIEEVVKNLYEERIQEDSSAMTSKTLEDAPALILSKAYADVDDLRIYPDIQKSEFLTRNTAINSEIKESPDESNNSTVRYKHAGQSELDIGLEEIRRIFDEEKVPLHPFIDLTNSGIEKTSQKSKVQGLESGLDLLKPESLDGKTMTENMTVCHTLPGNRIDKEITNTNIADSFAAETTNLERNELSKPMIPAAKVQFSEAAADIASLKKKVESRIEALDQSPQSKADTELKSFIDKPTEAIQLSKASADIVSAQEKVKSRIKTLDPSPTTKVDTELKSFIDNRTEAIQFSEAAADTASAQEKVKSQERDQSPSKSDTDPLSAEMSNQVKLIEEMSLSELLKRVRQKSRNEAYEQIMFTSQVPEVEPCAGKPPCTPLANPPPKILPPRPCPPKPKKNKKEKKDPCAKFKKNSTLDTLGLVVTIRVPKIEIPQNYHFPEKGFDVEKIPKVGSVMLVTDRMECLVEDEKYANFANRILSQRVLNFIKEYEPWDSPFLLVFRGKK